MSRKTRKKRAASENAVECAQPSASRDTIYDWADNLLFAGVLVILFFRAFLSGRTYPQYNHFFHIAVGVLAILWLVKCWRKRTLELHNRLLTGFMIAFLVVCSLTFFTTVDKGATLRYIYEILSYTLLFLVIANNFREASSVKTAVATILVAAFLVNCYGLFQRYYTLEMTRRYIEEALRSGDEQLLMGVPLGFGILHRLESTRVFSTFIFPNAYALFLGMAGSLTLGWIWSMRGGMTRFTRTCWENLLGRKPADGQHAKEATRPTLAKRLFVGIGGLLLMLLFLVSCLLIPWDLWLTYSRGGWLNAAAIALVFVVVGFWKRKLPRGKVAGLVVAAIFFVTLFSSVHGFSAETLPVREVSVLERLKDSLTVVQRLSYWRAALAMIRDNPWLGVGWGAFEEAYPRYMVLGGYPVKLAHNNYLQVWAETGIVGLNAFIGLWLVFLYTFWRKVQPESSGELRGIVCGLGAGVIGFLTDSLVNFALYSPTLAYFVFALLGLLVAMPTLRKEEDKFSIRLPGFAAAILIVIVCGFMWFLFKSYAGMNLYIRAEAMRNTAFPNQFARRRGFEVDPEQQRRALTDGVTLLKKSIRYFPLDADSHHMLGDSYLRLAVMDKAPYLMNEAIQQLHRATELNPWSPYVFQSLATAYWAAGNEARQPEFFQKALLAEQQASRNFPTNPEYHDKLGQIYRALGLEKKAEEEAALAKKLKKHYREF